MLAIRLASVSLCGVTMSRVLVIEDEIINRHILKQSLEQQGYDVEVASDGASGLAIARTFLPCLIICDWVMPQMSGIEVCQRIKADPKLIDIFFILLTARSEIQDRIEGLDSGADDFLNKPVELGELQARVRAGLRIYQAQQKLRQLANALQIQQKRLDTELAQAASYVASLLPQSLSGRVQVDSRFFPSQQLGGDCFDFYWLDDDRLVLYLLDVSGHGLGAALPSVSMQQVLRSQSLPKADFYDPKSVLSALNQIFQMSEQNPRFFTIWYGVYCHSRRSLVYASAGHPPAILITPANDCQTVGKEGQLPIGMFADSEYETHVKQVESGSTLYLFSDGLYEIQQTKGSLWSYQQFAKMLGEQHQQASRISVSDVVNKIRQIKQTESFEDDCSIVQVCF